VNAMRTPKNILQHELIGLRCRVMAAKNKSQVGVSGKIRDETLKTLVIDDKRIPKAETIFRVWLDESVVDIDGKAISARPEERIKKIIKRWGK
jgi:ribonuclease P protein subunit POP4